MLDQTYTKLTSEKGPLVDDILACQSQDETGLNDFQKLPAKDHIAIPKVGINRFRLPILMKTVEGDLRSHDAVAKMFVSLNEKKNGVSMSRLVSILQEESMQNCIDANSLKKLLMRYKEELRDETDTQEMDLVGIKLSFDYALKQKSLKSDNWGWQYYPVEIEATLSRRLGFEYFIKLAYEYSSTCPCSLSMAKQYEREFAQGKTKEGVGIGVPHSQRSLLRCKVKLVEDSVIDINALVMLIRQAIPTETQSLVKRQDEQAFAILNGTHPMFVEHATKRMHLALNAQKDIRDWIVELEHIESLHSHNAAAVIYKGIDGGLSSDTIF